MKQITLDFETYEKELEAAKKYGFRDGITEVARWLESKERLMKYLEERVNKCDPWGRVAIALGREEELKTL